MKLRLKSKRVALLVVGGLVVLLLVGLIIVGPSGFGLLAAAFNTEPPLNLSCDPVTQISKAECQALLALYQSTQGETWVKSTGWFRTTTPCEWYGVVCDADNHVSELYLQVNGLKGPLPASLQDLSSLKKLLMQRNKISGQLPPELGSLQQLAWLEMSQNQITGTLPVSLTLLPSLERLNLGYNQLQGAIPPELANLQALNGLYLHFNQLTGAIPPELGSLPELRELYLASNQLEGPIPPELGQLSQLVSLHLENNRLSGSIPAELSQMADLQTLALQENLLTGGLPDELVGLDQLSTLTINSNAFQGEIPASYMSMGSLGSDPGDVVDFGYNGLFTPNSGLADKLTQHNPNWLATQTIAPGAVKAFSTRDGLQVRWQAIPYAADGGYYEISYGEDPNGPFTEVLTTIDKTVDAYLLQNLTLGKTYYVRLRTYTPTHGAQKNELWSDYSSVASALYDGTSQDPGGLGEGSSLYLPVTIK